MSKDFIHHLACKCGGEFEKFIECETLVFEGIVYFFFFFSNAINCWKFGLIPESHIFSSSACMIGVTPR